MLKRIDDGLLYSIKQPQNSSKRFYIYDTLIKGLRVSVSSRSITFYLYTNAGGKRQMHKLGLFPNIDTATAQTKAVALLTGTQHKPTFLEPYSNAPAASTETLSELLARYHSSRQLSDATKTSMIKTFRQGLRDWLDQPAHKLTATAFEGVYRGMLNRGVESSARMTARYVRAIYRWAELDDPTNKLTQKTGHSANKIESKDRRIEAHQMDAFKRIMPTLTSEQQLSIMIALTTGMRKSELQSVALSSLCFDTQSIKLAKTKNGKAHQVPLPESLWQQLIEASKGKAPDEPLLTIGDKLPKQFTQTIPLSWHDCRRTAASTLISLGKSESVVKALLNHSDKKDVTQAHYLRFDREQIRQSVDKLLNYFSSD